MRAKPAASATNAIFAKLSINSVIELRPKPKRLDAYQSYLARTRMTENENFSRPVFWAINHSGARSKHRRQRLNKRYVNWFTRRASRQHSKLSRYHYRT